MLRPSKQAQHSATIPGMKKAHGQHSLISHGGTSILIPDMLKFNKNSWQAAKISTVEALAKEIIYRKQAKVK